MKKILLSAGLILMLFSCQNEETLKNHSIRDKSKRSSCKSKFDSKSSIPNVTNRKIEKKKTLRYTLEEKIKN